MMAATIDGLPESVTKAAREPKRRWARDPVDVGFSDRGLVRLKHQRNQTFGVVS
jgi:hypothetical protein